MRETDVLSCSFCGKRQNEVRKLIAGPTVYICNECVDVCNEVIGQDLSGGAKRWHRTKEFLGRAADDLDAARLLAEHGRSRAAINTARTSALNALWAYEYTTDGRTSGLEFDHLVSLCLNEDAELRALEGLDVTALLKEYGADEAILDGEAESALRAADLILAYVRRKAAE